MVPIPGAGACLVAWWLGEMGTFVAGPQATKGVFLRKAVIAWVMHAKLVLYFHCTIGRGRMGENEEEEDDGGGTGARLLAESTIHVIVTRPSILLPHTYTVDLYIINCENGELRITSYVLCCYIP